MLKLWIIFLALISNSYADNCRGLLIKIDNYSLERNLFNTERGLRSYGRLLGGTDKQHDFKALLKKTS